jgi:hypothetical protein
LNFTAESTSSYDRFPMPVSSHLIASRSISLWQMQQLQQHQGAPPQLMVGGGGGVGMPQPGHSYQQAAAFEYPGAAVAGMAVMGSSAPQGVQ